MRVLGLETSCDETGVALYDSERGLLADALFSQIDLHRVYGGVVPELASRDHVKRMLPLIRQVLDESGCTPADIDAIAYTAGPGLVGALLVGTAVWLMQGSLLQWVGNLPGELMTEAGQVLAILCLGMLLKVFNMVGIVGVLRSGGDVNYSIFIDIVGMWCIGLPLA